MFDVHHFNPDALAAELSWRRESLGQRRSIHTLPRWRRHPGDRSHVVRRHR